MQGATALDKSDATYLRVIINAVQAKLGPKKGRAPAAETQLSVFSTVVTPLYAAVLRGVTTEDIAIREGLEPAELTRRMRERNRRATFARTARSALVSWVNAGGDIRALDVSTVTKSELQRSVAAAREPDANRTVERAQKRILASVAAVARG